MVNSPHQTGVFMNQDTGSASDQMEREENLMHHQRADDCSEQKNSNDARSDVVVDQQEICVEEGIGEEVIDCFQLSSSLIPKSGPRHEGRSRFRALLGWPIRSLMLAFAQLGEITKAGYGGTIRRWLSFQTAFQLGKKCLIIIGLFHVVTEGYQKLQTLREISSLFDFRASELVVITANWTPSEEENSNSHKLISEDLRRISLSLKDYQLDSNAPIGEHVYLNAGTWEHQKANVRFITYSDLEMMNRTVNWQPVVNRILELEPKVLLLDSNSNDALRFVETLTATAKARGQVSEGPRLVFIGQTSNTLADRTNRSIKSTSPTNKPLFLSPLDNEQVKKICDKLKQQPSGNPSRLVVGVWDYEIESYSRPFIDSVRVSLNKADSDAGDRPTMIDFGFGSAPTSHGTAFRGVDALQNLVIEPNTHVSFVVVGRDSTVAEQFLTFLRMRIIEQHRTQAPGAALGPIDFYFTDSISEKIDPTVLESLCRPIADLGSPIGIHLCKMASVLGDSQSRGDKALAILRAGLPQPETGAGQRTFQVTSQQIIPQTPIDQLSTVGQLPQ